MSDLTPKENTALDITMTQLSELVGRMEKASHPYPRERTWSDCEEELKRRSDDLTTAALYGFHQRDDEVAALKAEIARLRDAAVIARTTEANLHEEIEQLRGLLRENLEGDAFDPADWVRRVREALGK